MPTRLEREKRRTGMPGGARPLTARELARRCGVDLRTVHHWVEDGLIAYFRTPGRHLRFDVAAVDQFLAALAGAAPRSAPRAGFSLLIVARAKALGQLQRAFSGRSSACLQNPYEALIFAGSAHPSCIVLEPTVLRGLDTVAYVRALVQKLPASKIFWLGAAHAGPSVDGLHLVRDTAALCAAIALEGGRSSGRQSSSGRRGRSARRSKS